MTVSSRLAAALLAVVIPTAPLLAADPAGRYAVDGVGRLDCARFVAAHEEDGADLRMFAGWLDGYLTGINHLQPDTFDITPWQTVELLALKLRRFCEDRPETRFVDALNQLALALYPQRLAEESEMVRVRRDRQAVFLYREQIGRIERRLAELGYQEAPDEAFTSETSDALLAFQTAEGLPESGLPDQPTLNALFR